jgi:ferric-dicitrate binding protein FerR (iron transport regulator)
MIKYLNNECSGEEFDELWRHVTSIQRDEALEEGLEEVWDQLYLPKELSKIFSSILSKSQEIEGGKNSFSWTKIYKLAAVFVGIIFFASVAILVIKSNQWKEEQTGYGQTKEITLPDGSKVTLNGNSKLEYKSSWRNDDVREVSLTGEAFFEVTHKTNNQKFIVKTRDLSVEVLGTEFNVMSRKTRSYVVLRKGSVRLAVEGKEDWVMKPGEMVEVDKKGINLTSKKVNPENYVSWRNNVLAFQSNSLEEIAQMIEENYDLQVEIPDKSLARERFTGAFPLNEDIEVLLKMLAKSYHFKIDKSGDVIIFRSGKQGPPN